jgi:hypothetical protein
VAAEEPFRERIRAPLSRQRRRLQAGASPQPMRPVILAMGILFLTVGTLVLGTSAYAYAHCPGSCSMNGPGPHCQSVTTCPQDSLGLLFVGVGLAISGATMTFVAARSESADEATERALANLRH